MSNDYSRPVGWWCPVCGASGEHLGPDTLLKMGIVRCCTSGAADEMCFTIVIPVFLPIPEGQRPLVDDEVDEAEVVTWVTDFGLNVWGTADWNFFSLRWDMDPAPDINYIVTGSTE